MIEAIAGGGGLANLAGVIYQNEMNRRERKNQQNFQSEMAGSSYQRGVADLRAAGLNPMLAYTQGGAETPSTGMAQFENPGEGLASTALEATRLKEEIKAIRANVEKTQQDTNTSAAQEKLIEANTSGAKGDAKVKQALGKTAEILQPGLNKIQEALGQKPIQMKGKD